MSRPSGTQDARILSRARLWLARRLGGQSDGGFILLESMIAITIITVVMGAIGAEFVSGMASSVMQRAKQAAVEVGDSAVEQLRSLHASDLLGGRSCPAVQAQLTSATATSSAVAPWLANMSIAVDPTYAGTNAASPCTNPPSSVGATATIPTTAVTRQPGGSSGVTYAVSDFLGWCWIPSGSGDCTTTQSGIKYLRAVVAVTWTGPHCATSTCSYVTSTLVSTNSDPTFQVNQPLPPAPNAVSPGDQTVEVADAVNLQLSVNGSTGVPPFTWSLTSGPLPGSLQLSPTGLVTGTVSAAVGTYPVTVKVTDAFLRTDTATFNWIVDPPLQATAPAAQSSTVGTTITPVTLTATGGSGSNVWTDASPRTLPAGLSLSSSGLITGSPTTTGTSTVKLTVTDSTNHAQTVTFTWTVYSAATVSNLGAVSATEGQNVDTTVNYTCPSMTCTLTLAGSVPGAGLATTASTGNNTVTTMSVTGSGTVHVTGTVQSNAVTTGATKAYTPTVKITNPAGTSATTPAVTWTAYAPPSVTMNAATTSAVGATPSDAVSYSCPNTPCTITLSGTVPGVGLSSSIAASAANATTSLTVNSGNGTVYLNGLISASAASGNSATTYTPSLVIKDNGAVTASDNETWSVYAKPTVGSPGSISTSRSATPSKSLVVTCAATGSAGCTVSVSGLPSGVGLGTSSTSSTNSTTSLTLASNSTTVFLSGKVSSTAPQQSYPVTITVVDNGISVSSVGVWTVS